MYGDLASLESLERANPWKEVSGRLSKDGVALSGNRQQRLCIARVFAVQADAISTAPMDKRTEDYITGRFG